MLSRIFDVAIVLNSCGAINFYGALRQLITIKATLRRLSSKYRNGEQSKLEYKETWHKGKNHSGLHVNIWSQLWIQNSISHDLFPDW